MFGLRPSKKEAEQNDIKEKMRPVYCPKCGWKLLDAVSGMKTQTKIPHKGRYPDLCMKCGHCGAEVGIIKTE